jgi:hypothetical protein
MTTPHALRPASLARKLRTSCRLGLLALCGVGVAGAAGIALAQDSDQQIRCMQLQQELASASGGGAARDALPGIEKQIADATRVFQGTQAAMEDASCYQSFLIFGRGLVRSPNCLKMNDRVEDARHQLDQLQDQRSAIMSGGGNRRRQADLQDALARNGCGGAQAPQQARRPSGGGLFNWFGGGGGRDEEQAAQPEAPVYRSIDPNGRYRAVCVRTCDGFFFPITYSTYANRLAQDATQCQANCAAPAELYVYRNPGQEIDQAISLNGTAYKDLPAAFKYRKAYVKGCSCKEAEYNPTEIEAAQKADAAAVPSKPGGKKKPQAAAPAAAPAPPAEAEAPAQPDPAAADAPAPQAAAPQAAPDAGQSSMSKSKTPQ